MRPPADQPMPRRSTDRWEAVVSWLLTAVALGGLGVALLAGVAEHTNALDRGRVEAASRTAVSATLTEDVTQVIGGTYGSPETFANASWTAPDGSPRTDTVPAWPGARAGSAVEIWVDGSGALSTAPTSEAEALGYAAMVTTGVLMLTGCFVATVWWALRRTTSIVNDRRWTAEWAVVERQWRRKKGMPDVGP